MACSRVKENAVHIFTKWNAPSELSMPPLDLEWNGKNSTKGSLPEVMLERERLLKRTSPNAWVHDSFELGRQGKRWMRMDYFGVKFASRFTQIQTGDSSIVNCEFDGFKASGSGGGVYVSGLFSCVVKNCRFCNCESGGTGGGVCLETTSSNITKSLFISCFSSANGYGSGQLCSQLNDVSLCSYHLCSVIGNPWSTASMIQKVGFSSAIFLNGSHLLSANRECGYHHWNGPLSHISFSTYSCCSGSHIISFNCYTSPTQNQENICTSNSSARQGLVFLDHGSHWAKNFVMSESSTLIYRGTNSALRFEDSIFGSPQITASWLTTIRCRFNCNQQMLAHALDDKSRCFHNGSLQFTQSKQVILLLLTLLHFILTGAPWKIQTIEHVQICIWWFEMLPGRKAILNWNSYSGYAYVSSTDLSSTWNTQYYHKRQRSITIWFIFGVHVIIELHHNLLLSPLIKKYPSEGN